MAPIKIGMIGYGGSAVHYHLPLIVVNPDFVVHAFLQRTEAPSIATPAKAGVDCTVNFPNARHYRNAQNFFRDPDTELVVICTQTITHAELTEQALLCGKHGNHTIRRVAIGILTISVVVEKPFTVSSQQADRLIALSEQTDEILRVYQNRRYDSDCRTVERLIQEGTLGNVTEFESRFDLDNLQALLWSDLNPGDGMLYVLGGHTIYQALVLFGLPASVTAFTRSLRDRCKLEDAFYMILQYDG